VTAKKPKVQPGYRFTLRHDVDRFPDFIARQGMTGIVIEIRDDGFISAKIDQPIDGAEGWDNELWWYDGLPEFHDDTIPL
jgi:hypothetical protein